MSVIIDKDIKGWNYIILMLIKNNFANKIFNLSDLYAFEDSFKMIYPSNLHIREKIRQTLQNLRRLGLLVFLEEKGTYILKVTNTAEEKTTINKEMVYLLSNECIPGWLKIGRTNNVDRRLKDLYNTSVPLPFKLENSIFTTDRVGSDTIEKSIHEIIDTLNQNARKNTEANRREFFKLTLEQGNHLFALVSKIMAVETSNVSY